MDYNIKFKYEGMGKQASGIRNKVLQSQKKGATSKSGVSQSEGRGTISALKTLNTSIQKLIASNKSLEKTMKGGGAGGGGGGGGGRGGAGVGRMGSSIPILGASIALLGFTIQKVNQIGNAYIAQTSQQLGTVGVGGFRSGKGIYTGAERGAGMKSYGMATGKFQTGKKITRSNEAAMGIGSIFGMSPEESLRTSGQFKRAGANYQGAAAIGAGMGIESELSTMMTGMATILTDAVKEGINTSDMSKDMARELSVLTMATPGKSVDAVLNMVKNSQGVKKQVAAGNMNSVEGLFMAKASQQIMMENLSGEKGALRIQKLQKGGYLSEKEAGRMMIGLPEGSEWSDLMKMAPKAAHMLLRKSTEEVDPTQLLRRMMTNAKSDWGSGAEGGTRFKDFARANRFTLSDEDIHKYWMTDKIPEGVKRKGPGILAKQEATVTGSTAAFGKRRKVERENLVATYGKSFAVASLKMERAMITLAKGALPGAIAGIEALGAATKKVSDAINSNFVKDYSKRHKKKRGIRSSEPSLYETFFGNKEK